MSKTDNALSRTYICPKCRGQKPAVREVTLARSGLLEFIPGRDARYLEVTCTLCGYTEFYNRAIYLASLEPSKVHVESALPERANGG